MVYELPPVRSPALEIVEAKYGYVVFSECDGVISKHCSAAQASKAFAADLVKHGTGGGRAILKRAGQVWRVF